MAIGAGGPGAVFWMWVMAFIGAGSAFVESTLAQIYKIKVGDEFTGGAPTYIEKGLKLKWLAMFFAIVAGITLAFFDIGIQANTIAESLNEVTNIPNWIIGLVVAIVAGLILMGGAKKIGRAAEIIVPFMAVFYLGFALIIMAINFREVPRIFGLIFSSAFSFNAVFGGIVGLAISNGVKRALFSNGAGTGTGAQYAGAANVSHPVKQGMVQCFANYIDTLLVCTATAFMILVTDIYNVVNPAGGFLVENVPGVAPGVQYTQMAVDSFIPGFGKWFLAIAVLLFAFSTILGSYYFAENNLLYVIKKCSEKTRKTIINVFMCLVLVSAFVCSFQAPEIIWSLVDTGLGTVTYVNLFAILLLHKQAIKALRNFEAQQKQGIDPVFRGEDIGLTDLDYWHDTNVKQSS